MTPIDTIIVGNSGVPGRWCSEWEWDDYCRLLWNSKVMIPVRPTNVCGVVKPVG